jgi:hypothetical protein
VDELLEAVFGESGIGEIFRPGLREVLCETTKQGVSPSVHQDGRRPRVGFPEILETKATTADISMPCHKEQIHRNRFRSTTSIQIAQ